MKTIYFTKKALFLNALFIFLIACGNEGGSYRKNEQGYSSNSSTVGVGTYDYTPWMDITDVPDDALCSSNENILPNYDKNIDNTGKYRLCKTTQSNSILYFSTLLPEESVCIFPAYYTRVVNTKDQYAYHTFKTPGVEPGTPYSVCINLQSKNFVYIDFIAALKLVEGSMVNGAYVVPLSQRSAMAQCLRVGNPYQCPQTYSFGAVE